MPRQLGHVRTAAAHLAAAVGVVVALAATAAAAVAQGAAAGTPPGPAAWTVALAAEQLWESNVRFLEAEGAGDFVSRVGGSVAGEWRGRRGRAGVAATGDVMRFRALTDQDRLTYGASAEGSRRLTQRLDGHAGYAMRLALARDLAPVADAGVLLPLALSRATGASGQLAYRGSPTPAARFEARHDRVTFDTPALDDGWSAGARVALDRRTSARGAIGVAYEAVHNDSRGRQGMTHGLAARWERQLADRLTARLDAGVLRAEPLGGAGAVIEPQGGAELLAGDARTAFGARVSRSASQAFGLGRVLITDQVGATFRRELTRRLGVELRATRSMGDDPADDGFAMTSDDVAAEMRLAITPELALRGGAFLRRREAGASDPAVASRGASVSFAYGRVFR